MAFLDEFPVWGLALFIYCLRICDVSLGTIRTISVVNGRVKFAVFLGFFEILVWVVAITSVIVRINQHPVLPFAYAAGFATGNACGIWLERKLALGQCAVRMISSQGAAVAQAVQQIGKVVATFRDHSSETERTLVFLVLPRRALREMLDRARAVDPELFWIVERFAETSRLEPLPHATGWRSVFKMK